MITISISITYRNHYPTNYNQYQKYLFERIRSLREDFITPKKWSEIRKLLTPEGQYGPYKIEGIKTGYYENGVKFYETNFVGGFPSGSTKVWFESGKKQLIGYFKDGERDSTWIIWNKDGSKRSESSYKNGKRL